MATSARIDELLKKFEENPRRYFAPLANEYRKAGDPERAVAICEEHLPQQPGHMSGHIVYGQALFELGRYDEARQVFETALSLDPENLIALRHLGDIARMAGDAHSARIWYQRVLEADPRNEEIAQLMMTLLSTPIATDAITTTPTPLSTPGVATRPSSPTPTAAVEEPLDDPQFATTEEIPPPAPPVAPTYTPFPPPSVSPQSFVSRHAPKEDELLDLDSFDLGGVPLSSLRNAKNAEPEPAPEEIAPPSDRSDDSAFAEFDEQLSRAASADTSSADTSSAVTSFAEESFVEHSFADGPAPVFEPGAASPSLDAGDAGIEKAEEFADGFEADPFAIAAKPLMEGDVGSFEEAPPGTIELAADVSLGLPDDGEASSTFTSEEEGPAEGFESFEPGMTAGSASSEITNEALETEAFFDRAQADFTESSADALLDSLDQDSDALAGASAFSQIRDDSTDALVDESSFAASFDTSLDTQLDESVEVTQGDPLLAPAFGTPAPDVEAVDTSTATPDDLAAIATPDSAEAEAHVPDAESSSGETGAFVTETMATLYLEQGHYDAALDIYRQLVRQRPEDIALRDRLHAAEERAWGQQRDLGVSILDEDTEQAASFAQDEEAVVPQPRSYGGPTIREFLNGILYRVSAVAVEEPSDFSEPEDTVEPESQVSLHDDVAPEGNLPLATEGRSTPPAASPSDSVSTSLDALFSEADAATPSPESLEGSSLGGAVATPISGTPAHRAPTELSLDHVFKSNTPRVPEKEGFSFDQFFSEGAAEQSTPRAEPANEPHVETGDDIAQFNAWLNGLKKS